MTRSNSTGVQITERMRAICEEMGRQFEVAPDIHEQDLLLKHILAKSGPKALESYFVGGHRDAVQVANLANRLFANGQRIKILEFASGYGRVTRHLRTQLSEHRLIASDIHLAACRFVQDKIGVETRASHTEPERLEVGDDYDLIVVLSLFSHLPPRTFGRWLAALYRTLKVGGYLVVTTHGPASMERFPIQAKGYSPRRGLGYRGLSDQGDLDPRDYGTMVVSLPYFSQTVAAAIPSARIESFASGIWFGSQDEWVIRRGSIDPTAARLKWTLARRLGRFALRVTGQTSRWKRARANSGHSRRSGSN
jgi:SAM-dependent methyltransferase